MPNVAKIKQMLQKLNWDIQTQQDDFLSLHFS